MTKAEFIRGLQNALAEAPDALIIENVNYYSSYIDGELRKGRSEAEVMDELGEPQWIAKSILDAHMGSGQASWQGGTYDYSSNAGGYEGDTYTYDATGSQPYQGSRGTGKIRTLDLSKWYVKALLIAIPIVILVVFFSLMGMAMGFVFRMLFSPIFWGVLLGFAALKCFLRR